MLIEVMSWAIILVIALSILHFFYEGVILPSLRYTYRFKLFALRDRVRRLMINEEISKELFNHLNDGINATVGRLREINISNLMSVDETLKRDPSLMARAEKYREAILNCEVEEVKAIQKRCRNIYMEVFLLNSLAMICYFMPVFFVIWFLDSLKPWKRLKELATWFVTTNHYDRDRVMPPSAGMHLGY